jgi:hypothetical protein
MRKQPNVEPPASNENKFQRLVISSPTNKGPEKENSENRVARMAIVGNVVLMNWQQVTSLMIVALAAGLLLWGRFRRRKFSFEGSTHCGCPGHAGSATEKTSILFHARKGERRAVFVKIK